ncbi:MAG: TRAP transporter small permease subunit [Sneathiellaceae bacterium]
MNRLEKLAGRLRGAAELVVVLLLGSMFVTFLVQIAFRYLLSLPLGWTVEYVTMAWLWGILFGYAFVVRDDDVIRFDLVYAAVPPPVRRGMDILTGLACAGILLWSLPKAWDFVLFMGIERTAYMRLPFDLLFAIYVPFAIAVSLRALLGVWHALRGEAHRPGPPRDLEHD